LRYLGIKKAFGADSKLAQFEFQEEDKSEDAKKLFVVCMNLLLNWASIPKKKENELLEL
jgi:hypothetical protein